MAPVTYQPSEKEVHTVEITAGHVWTIVAAAMVFFMTPGLALFYGGMTRAKGVLNMMMMSFISIAFVSVVWVLWGYSMSGGDPLLGGLTGSPVPSFALGDIMGTEDLLAAAYGGTFAIITVALISGAMIAPEIFVMPPQTPKPMTIAASVP